VSAPDAPVYDILKVHLTITSGACAIDPALVVRVLKEYRARLAPAAPPDWQAVADRQIDFYIAELAYAAPPRLPEDVEAREHARQYLRQVKGIDRIYNGILAGAASHVGKGVRLGDLASNYNQVLAGPESVDPAFSREGLASFENASKKSNSGFMGE